MRLLSVGSLLLALCLVTGEQGPIGYDVNGDALPPGAVARLGSLRFRHDAPITCQAVTLDGKLIATGGGRSVLVWDAATGRQLHALSLQAANRAVVPTAVAFSPDGTMLAGLGAYGAGIVVVWDLRGGQMRQEMSLPAREDASTNLAEAPFLAFGPTNQQLLIRNFADKSIGLYDLQQNQVVRTFQSATSTLNCFAVSNNGKQVAAGTEGKHVIVWDVASGKEVQRLHHEFPLVHLAFSPTGEQIATLDQDLAPIIWNIAAGKINQTLPARTRSISLAWQPQGKALYVARQPGEVLRWSLADKMETSIKLNQPWVHGPLLPVASANAEWLLLGSPGRLAANSAKVHLLDVNHPEKATQFDGYESPRFYPLYLAGRKQWATIGIVGDNMLRYWDATGRLVQSMELPVRNATLGSFAACSDGRLIALSGADGSLLIVDAVAGKVKHTIAAFGRACWDTEFTSDGKLLVATDARTVKRFDVATGALVNSYDLSTVDSFRTVISQDGSRILSQQTDSDEEQAQMRIIHAANGKVIASETKSALHQGAFFFGPDGRNFTLITTLAHPPKLSVHEVASGKPRFAVSLPQPFEFFGSMARISTDGRWLVSSGVGRDVDQATVLLWQLGTARDPIILTGLRGMISTCHFSPDSKQLLTVNADGSMLVWDLERQAGLADTPLAEKDYTKHWQMLGSDDAAKAYQAIHRWARQPEAAEWLGQQIRESSTLMDVQQIRTWIKQLNSSKYQDREQASQLLTRHAAVARTELNSALQQASSAEVKRRLTQIIEKASEVSGFSDNPLTITRALEALELMKDPRSLAQLQLLAKRTDPLGLEAQDAVVRLQARLK